MQIKIGANRLERNVGPRTLDRVIRKRTTRDGDIRTEISVGRNQPCGEILSKAENSDGVTRWGQPQEI